MGGSSDPSRTCRRFSCRSGRGREDLPQVWEGSGKPPVGPGGREDLQKVHEG